MTSVAREERSALADLLDTLGPDEPTLCDGWNTRDLAAHVVLRERRLDAAPGIVVPALAGYTARVQHGYAGRPWPELVTMLRTGPPAWSPYRIPALDDAANTVEMFVHHEDVRRAQPAWEPRDVGERARRTLWKALSRHARFAYRKAPVGVLLRNESGEEIVAHEGAPQVVLVGPATEHLLHALGRGAHALLETSGPLEAVDALAQADLRA